MTINKNNSQVLKCQSANNALFDFPTVTSELHSVPLGYPSETKILYACLVNKEELQKDGIPKNAEVKSLVLPTEGETLERLYTLAKEYNSEKLTTIKHSRDRLAEKLKSSIKLDVECNRIQQLLMTTEASLIKGGKSFYEFGQKNTTLIEKLGDNEKIKFQNQMDNIKLAFANKMSAEARINSFVTSEIFTTKTYSIVVIQTEKDFKKVTSYLSKETIELNVRVGLDGPLSYNQIRNISNALDQIQNVLDLFDRVATRIEIGYHTYNLIKAKSDKEKIKAIDGLIKLATDKTIDIAVKATVSVAFALVSTPGAAVGIVVALVVYLKYGDDALKNFAFSKVNVDKLEGYKRDASIRGKENLRELDISFSDFERKFIQYLFNQ